MLKLNILLDNTVLRKPKLIIMRKLYFVLSMGCLATGAFAQSAIDAYRFSQPDLRGTARFMGMGGAFGALGGDLSTLSQNPAGIGVYRSNELGFTLDLDVQKSTSDARGLKTSDNQTKFYLDNIGGVATIRLGSSVIPNLNFGFTYNKAVSFNRRYKGSIDKLQTSMSNYIAGIANNQELTVPDVETTDTYDPYNPNDGGIQAPWLAILGYDSYLINPNGDPNNPSWTGQFGDGTSGKANFDVTERGSVDEYNIAFGGNISNVVYWGMNFDIINFDYRLDSGYGEDLTGAYVYNPTTENVAATDSRWRMRNAYRANGTGFNYQLGVIVKPIQELRLGLAFHTPTWYNMTETYSAGTSMQYYGQNLSASTNDGYPGSQDYNFNSPWKVIASVAGVIGSKFIISADYEWNGYKTMKFSEANNYYGGDGYWDDPWDYDYYSVTPASLNNDPYAYENEDIKNVYRHTDTFRIGAEYRVTPSFSVRAGYSHVSSPVDSKAKNNDMTIFTAGTIPNYRFDNDTNYITCGLGYRHKGFYIDLAYVYKQMTSEYHAFTPDPKSSYQSPSAKLTFNNSRIVLSTGLKF